MTDAIRRRLKNRRESVTFNFVCGNFHYVATVSFFDDGRLKEIFIGNGKAGSGTDTAAKDSAVVASIALQHGVPLDVIRHRCLETHVGAAASPLGAALDVLAGEWP